MTPNTIKALASIIGITIIATTALLIGINGAVFFLATTALAGLGGFYIAKSRRP